MIIINRTLHGINTGDRTLIPGTNTVPDGAIDVKHPIIAAMIADGDLTVRENLENQGDAAEAIANANTAAELHAVEAQIKKTEPLKKAVEKRKKDLDDFDAKVAAGIQKAKGKK